MIYISGRGGLNLNISHQNWRFKDATFPTRAPISYTVIVTSLKRVFAWVCG